MILSIKKIIILNVIVILVSATVIFGLKVMTIAPTEKSDATEAEATRYPFKLVVTLDKTSYKQGEPVRVKWTLINVGDENVTLYHSADLFDFVVYNENFSHVFSYRNVSGLYPVYYLLPPIYPSENITKTGNWDQIYDNAKFVNPGVSHEICYEKVSLGTYYITGVFVSFTWFNGGAIATPPIKIIIS